MIRALIRVVRVFPARLELEYMRWAAREVHPLHPDVGFIASRMAELKERLS